MKSALVFAAAVPFLAVASAHGSVGCGAALPPGLVPGGPSQNISIVSYGVNRTYLLHIPEAYCCTAPAPLYFSFAGASRNASEEEGLSQFSNPIFNADGIAVYPEGINDHWLSNPDVSVSHPNDLDFISTLLDDLKSTLCIDETRIYAAGKSNGGGFTNLLACNATLSANFAAFAAVSGAFYDTDATIGPCDPGRQSTPFLEFHGLNDTTVPYLGKTGTTPARSEYPIPVFMQAWAERNGCPADSPPSRTIPLYDGLVLKEEWDCGGESRVVEHYRENDLGHIWPSTEPNDDCFTMPHQCPDGHYVFNATAVIFDFFGRWTL